MSSYTNMAGQTFPLYDRSPEPPDCWLEERGKPEEEEHDRWEKEMGNGKVGRT